MINKPNASLLLPGELAYAIKSYVETVELAHLEETFIDRIINLLIQDMGVLEEAIIAMHKDKLIEEVVQADAVRDDLFIGFCDFVAAHKRLQSPAVLAAFEEIWPVIERAGTGLHALSYEDQSKKMEELFNELDRTPRQMALAALNAVSMYDEMKKSQVTFSQTYNNKLEVDSKKNYPSLREAKARAIPHVMSLLNAIEILEETSEDSYEALIDDLNDVTQELANKVKFRKIRI